MITQYLTYISGIISILSFVLQLLDAFPHYREERKAALFLSLGVFIGTILGALNSVNIAIKTEYGLIQIILIIIMVVVATALLSFTYMAIRTDNKAQRDEMYGVVGVGIGVFFLLLMAVAMSTAPVNDRKKEYSADELISLAKYNAQEKNYDRALELYESVGSSFSHNDPRKAVIDKNIESIKNEIAEQYSK